ncbi:MAG: hypothetical protein H7175_25095 [Burkholderiales bacterium]|nr:hypothetical protein [Anaerolineae bacterium]
MITLWSFALLTPVPTPTPFRDHPIDNQRMESFINSFQDCELPCWWGIRIGEMTFAEIEQTLAPLGIPFETDDSPTLNSRELYTEQRELTLVLHMKPENGVIDDIPDVMFVNIETDNERPVWTQYNMRTVLRHMGTPDAIYFQSSLPTDVIAPISYTFTLYYQDKGVVAEFSGLLDQGQNLCIDTVPYHRIFLRINRAGYEFDPARERLFLPQDSFNIETFLFDMSAEEFTELMLNDYECFEVTA